MADPLQGGMALGQMLFGKADPDAGLDAEGKVYRNAEALEEARIARSKRVAYDALPEALRKHPQLGGVNGDVNAAMGVINPNLSVLVEGNLKLGEMDAQDQRTAAMAKGDIPAYNRATALQAGKSYDPVVVADGIMRPDGIALGDDDYEVVPTPQTLATIEQREAQTERVRANIGNDRRKADAAVAKTGRAPQSGGRKPGAGAFDPDIVEQARERIGKPSQKTGGRPATVRDVAQQLADKGYPNEAERLVPGITKKRK